MASPGMDSRILGGGFPFGISSPSDCMRTPEYAAAQLGAFNDPTADKNYLGNCNEWGQIVVPSLSSNRGNS
ncbi:hypothetical protein KIW84_074935 [Lathyrus oleraceus]|uniref:Uncharacterized protein n=1 Tax=Pisum sativum TaxID=3888 RepID=A0A9D4VU21_PEA|nr:hypothetical protein KIW84_074935 [Pisum sativum]